MITAELQEKRMRTEKVLSNVSMLPTMPEVMMEVTKLLDDPSASTAHLSRIIGKDQGLVTKILAIANSPLYGLTRRVSTIDYAIIILGHQEIRNMVIALSMMEAFKNKNDKIMNYKEFWLHSILTGIAARRLASDFNLEKPGEAFVIGLIHDLGVSVIHKYLHSSFLAIVDTASREGGSFIEAEMMHLGLTHEEIAKMLANKWNFPASLTDAISYHHHPTASNADKKLASVVHLADYLVNAVVKSNFFWDKPFVVDQGIFSVLNIPADLDQITSQYQQLLEDEMKNSWLG